VNTTIAIRPLLSLAEMYPAVELQKTYWGDDAESVIPAHMLFSLANHGGHVLAAMDGEKMAGVLVGFIGTDNDSERPAAANLQMVSKRMVVLPEYRNQKLAERLKLAQRERTIEQGIRLVTWTFDPLLAPNAHLNIRKLGAICEKFRENYYGTEGEGGLAVLGSSDRLFVDWWVTHRRVKERIEGQRADLTLEQYLDANVPIVNPTTTSMDKLPRPAERTQDIVGAMALLEIPLDYPAIVRSDESLGLAWRMHMREQLNLLMHSGYIVTDFVRAQHEGRDRVFYLLSRRDSQFDFSQN
jgi:predicted GNAT superfamily acetyltransferase